jgi:hypothetical protein
MANLDRLVKEVKRDFGNKPIWLTEYGYQTNPPDSYLGVSPKLQAQYVSDAALRAYQTPNVTLLVQFLLRDEPNVARFQSGLFTTAGTAKPAYQSFRIPLAQVTRRGTRTSVWGQVRPGKGAQTYRLQARTGGSWHWVGSTARTNSAGFLSRSLTAPRGTLVRVWSPALRAYSWPLLVR